MGNYIDNKLFQQLMLERYHQRQNGETPRVSDAIGKKLMLITQNMLLHRHFIKLPEDVKILMESDGLCNCLKYIENYDPIIYENPFAYFSQIVYFAFAARKKREYKKYRRIQEYSNQDFDFIDVKTPIDYVEFRSAPTPKVTHNSGANNPRARAVLCVDTGEVFSTGGEAAQKYGMSKSSICKVCRGHASHAKGLKFEYVSDLTK